MQKPRANPDEQLYRNQKKFYYETLADDLCASLKREGVPCLKTTMRSQTTGDDEYVVQW